jgi:hypothetical protein
VLGLNTFALGCSLADFRVLLMDDLHECSTVCVAFGYSGYCFNEETTRMELSATLLGESVAGFDECCVCARHSQYVSCGVVGFSELMQIHLCKLSLSVSSMTSRICEQLISKSMSTTHIKMYRHRRLVSSSLAYQISVTLYREWIPGVFSLRERNVIIV